MKVCLINPGINSYNDTPPINLAFLAAALEGEGHTVKIIDKLSGANFFRDIHEFRPDVAGVTATTPVVNDAYATSDYCRVLGIRTIIGGVHASIMPEEAAKHADVVIQGEAEGILASVVENCGITGIVEAQPIADLDTLPLPAYHLLNMPFYTTVRQRVPVSFLSFAPEDSIIATPLTSRGCPHKCIFCWNSKRKNSYRAASAERVVEELLLLKKFYGVNAVFFIEDNFFFNRPRLRKICELMLDQNLGIIWGANSRVDNLDDSVLALAKEAGCRQITFGWESGSQRILDIIDKKSNVEQNYRSVEMCNKHGIIANGTVIIGNPFEREEDIRLTQKFLLESDIRGGVGVCIATPYPGSALWDWCWKNNRIPNDFNWEHFDYHHIPIHVCDIPEERLMYLVNETRHIAAIQFNAARR